MNHNRIFRVLNVIFLSCGYQIHWFSIEARKFQLTLVGFAYFVSLMIWYIICFQQHFIESSIFNFLNEVAPVLHKCIRLHVLMGIKVMVFTVIEMRHVMRSLNALVKALPENPSRCWSWNEGIAYVWLFSGLLINFGFALYIMIEMEFLMPTLQQIMHATSMFLPHFALASSVKLLNVTTWIARSELQNMRNKINEIFQKESYQHNISILHVENNNGNSLELSVIPKQPSDSQLYIAPMLLLTEQLTLLADAVQKVNDALQKQIILLFSMNSLCLLGATYSIVNYNISWNLLLAGPIGRSLIAFNSGVFVFICWDYICLSLANYYLETEKSTCSKEIIQILKTKSTLKKDVKSLLKDVKYEVEKRFVFRIFSTSPITKQTFLVMNALVGLAIAVFMNYQYFKDQIEGLQIRFDDE